MDFFETNSQTYNSVDNTKIFLDNPDVDDEIYHDCFISKDSLETFKRTIQLDFSDSMSRLAARVEILEKKVHGSTQHNLSNTRDVNLGLRKERRRSSHRDCTQEDLSGQRESINVNVEGPKLLPPDVFSFLATSKFLSKPSFMMLLVATVQLLMISFLIINSLDAGKSNDPPNRLNVPVNVNDNLLVLQFLAIVITCFGQTDVRQSLEVLYYGYDKNSMQDSFSNAVFAKWAASVFLRFTVGILSITVTFILIVTEENARDLLLNFTAMEFVSYLDDIAFLLSKWGYFGKTLKVEAVRVSEGRYDLQAGIYKRKDKCVRSFTRTSFLFILFIVMIALWSNIVRMQRNGSYLCPEIYVQFGDEISPELGTFSGYYEMVKSKKLFPTGRLEYRESMTSKTNAKFSYCSNDEVWVFYHDDGSIDALSETPGQCMWNAKSDVIGESTSPSYDILSSGSWFTKNDINATVPMQQFTMKCHKCDRDPDFCGYPVRGECNKETNRCKCEEDFYGRRCELKKPCTLIAIDDNHDFVGTQKWSREFSIFKDDNKTFQVKDRPVYVNKGSDYTEVIFFSGKRWALMSLKVSAASNLTSFFKHYDFNWTKYSVSFLTEAINFDTPKDSSSPIGLEWYTTENYALNSRKIQAPDFRKKSDALLLCKICDNISNPCFDEGKCINGKCSCQHGATGDLCQIPGTSNGVCNAYFNKLEYSFDGGDCCQESCKPIGNDNTCGSNRTSILQNYSVTEYVGYPNCSDTSYLCNEGRVCWRVVSGADNLYNTLVEELKELGKDRSLIDRIKFAEQLSISPSGNLIAVYIPEISDDETPVRVYEEFGDTWRKRKISDDISWSNIKILNTFFSAEAGVDIINLWILSEGSNDDRNYQYWLLTYEWNPQSQMYTIIDGQSFDLTSSSSMASMSDNGKVLAIASQKEVSVYNNFLHDKWIQIGQIISMNTDATAGDHDNDNDNNHDGEDDDAYLIQTISLSYDGKIVAFGSSRNVYVYKFNISIMEWNLVGDKNSGIGNYSGKALSLSNNGEMVAIGICSTTTPTPDSMTTLIPDLNLAQTLNTAGTPITLCNCSVFKFDPIFKKWNEIGNSIRLGKSSDDSSMILSLSHNGQKLAVVHNGDETSLRMYKFNSNLNDWDQYGSDIIKDDKSQARIESFSLSGDFKRAAIGQPLLNNVKLFYDANVSVKNTVPITIQVELGSGSSNVGVLLVCDSNVVMNVQLDHLVFSAQNLTLPVYINEKEQCQLTVAKKPTTISHGFFRIYNGTDVTKDANIIGQSSGGKFYKYSRETITFSSSPFSKAILKSNITFVFVPMLNPSDQEETFSCILLCDNNFSVEFDTNTKNSSLINTLFLETGAHCNINVRSLNGKIDFIKNIKITQAHTHFINFTPRKVVNSFNITSSFVYSKDDHDEACKHEFGEKAKVADWYLDIIEKYNEVDRNYLVVTLLKLQMNPVTIEQANFYFLTNYKKGVYFLGGDSSNYWKLFNDHGIIFHHPLWKWSYYSSYAVKGQVLCVLNSESYEGNGPTNSLPPNVDYLGCFSDNWFDRVQPEEIDGDDRTVADCVKECEGFKYLGRQNSGKCWCGNGDYGKQGNSHGCDCDGKYVGEEKQCVYKYKNVSTSVIPTIMHDTNVVVPSDPSS